MTTTTDRLSDEMLGHLLASASRRPSDGLLRLAFQELTDIRQAATVVGAPCPVCGVELDPDAS